MNKVHNPNCDGAYCKQEQGEVRVLPLGAGGNLILCRSCYLAEMRFRRMQLMTYGKLPEHAGPFWDNLEVYKSE